MDKNDGRYSIGEFPAPTLSQLEYILEERQTKDRRINQMSIDFQDRRKVDRREQDCQMTTAKNDQLVAVTAEEQKVLEKVS